MSHGLSIGVVGLGYWGPNLARNFSQLEDCRLGALCDLDAERLRKIAAGHPGVSRFEDLCQMLEDSDLDAVAIATPVPSHFHLSKACLLAGKHVLVEKPFASSVAECEELSRIASERGLRLMVGHTFLYSEPIRVIKEIIDSGDLGEIRYINSQRLNLGLFQKEINVVWDLAPHDLSIILHLLGGMPDYVNCQGNAHITPGIEDVSNLSLSFPTGQFATVQSSWLEPRKVRQMTIVGTRKMIVYDDIQPMEKIRIYDTRVERPPHYASFGEFQYSYHYGDSFIPYLRQLEPLRRMCQHFVDSVVNGAEPMTGSEGGLDVVKILEASSKSLRANGSAVRVESSGRVPKESLSATGIESGDNQSLHGPHVANCS